MSQSIIECVCDFVHISDLKAFQGLLDEKQGDMRVSQHVLGLVFYTWAQGLQN